jgi:hypothetical protein
VDVARNVTSHAPSNLAEAGASAGAAPVEVGEKRAGIAASSITARIFIFILVQPFSIITYWNPASSWWTRNAGPVLFA